MLNASRHAGISYYRGSNSAAADCDASPHRLISMLYDGLLQRLGHARNAMERSEIPAKLRSIESSLSIINYLQIILDHKAGGEFSRRLASLYEYMMRRLLAANANNDRAALDEVITLLTTIKSGWDIIESPMPGETSPSLGARSAA